jgi:hypothetical protein
MENLTITPGPVTGTEDFAAMEWAMEFVSKVDNHTFIVQKECLPS